MKRLLSATALGLSLAAASAAAIAPALAAMQISEEEDRRRSRQTLQSRTGQELNEALNLANEEPPQTQAAIQVLNELLARDMPPYDRATTLEIRGQLLFQVDRVQGALADFIEVLRLDVLPSDRMAQIRRNVAQLYYTQEQYDQAIRFMQEYIRLAGDEAKANDYFILAASYVASDNFRAARQPAETALRLDTDRKKQFYDLLNLIYSELGLSAERGELLETMVEYFPQEESYWIQLSGAYSEAGRDRDSFATLEAAYRAGLVDEEPKLRALAQFYYQLDNPFRGARMFEREMNAGNVSRDLRNLRLLSQLWAAAREQDKAIEILTEAAPKSDSGDLFYQLGQSYLSDERYAEAIDAFRQALRKGGLNARERGVAYLQIGVAYEGIDDQTLEGRQNSIEAYEQAVRIPATSRDAQARIDYIRAVQNTECRQDQVERVQAVERQQRQIERCESIVDVVDLGGAIEVDDETIAQCRTLLERVEAGDTAEEIVDEALGPLDRSQCQGS